ELRKRKMNANDIRPHRGQLIEISFNLLPRRLVWSSNAFVRGIVLAPGMKGFAGRREDEVFVVGRNADRLHCRGAEGGLTESQQREECKRKDESHKCSATRS